MTYRKSCFVRSVGTDVWAALTNQGDLHEEEVDFAVAVVMGVLARHHGQVIYNDPSAPVEPFSPESLTEPRTGPDGR